MKMAREYEFQFNGINFVSVVDVESPFYQRIKNLPEQLFVQMNLDILSNLINPAWSLSDIKAELVKFNEGGTYAFIELGKNSL